ncbi:Na/Pi cotransporter family protein [Faecalicatena contorta]|uniref:Na/Pi cotransporter family protein n=1 Tax=Faecalicatena contorta TaxID=39482 RepID=UPI001F19CE51|nr:Na/Pi cotransporter family protein [Faecalicatena contorta]MCF2555731.1 Na/Pi cotransporter family protein [Faecalicatena contorta]MCF2679963.1 Na/Pi cotransporter family protein [Faecalicatena contorta]
MNSNLEIIFGLLGGLAVFIFGMNMMSDCLQKAAGERMKSILALLTKNPVLGVLAGALTTAVLQSSSATTVMAIGFVSAGLMNLPQAISIILGANIGTTMTAQIIAFKLSDYIYIIIFIGFIISFVMKSEKAKNIGQTIFAFGLLFLGIETMGSVMKPLASSPVFTDMIAKVADIPVLGVFVGTFMTLVVQSSSATIAVLQNFAAQPGADGVSSILGLTGAIPILLGDNIGTTITALLASIGQTKDAKRTAVAHCIFNISGCLLFIWFVKPYAALIQYISPKGPEIEVISRQIANAHTFFNATMTLIWIPLIWLMVKIVMRIIPDGRKTIYSNSEPIYLDSNLVSQPTAALQLVVKEIVRCTELVGANLKQLISVLEKNDSGKISEVIKNAEDTRVLYDRITEYLAELFASGGLTEEQATQTAGIMYVLSDVDRMGALSREIGLSLKDKEEKKYKYSGKAMEDLKTSLQLIQKMFVQTEDMMLNGNVESAKKILKQKEQIMDLGIKMRKSHVQRVGKGKCSAKLTESFNKIIHSVDRMGNCCINMVDAVQGQGGLRYFLEYEEGGENKD